MTALSQYLPTWAETLGWTLLSSLWQAPAAMLLLFVILRLLPSRLSQVRYAIACAMLALIVALNASTFLYLSGRQPVATPVVIWEETARQSTAVTLNVEPTFNTVIDTVRFTIDANMPWIIFFWIIGTVLFSLRMASGWWHVSRLQAQAILLDDEWSRRLQDLARNLKIRRLVQLAQSARVDAPVVVGLFKPIILVPIGMFSGLTTEQIETIFIHELAHIKRHDYFINLLQSCLEAIFFFNPFIWMISNTIRREREFCCDDAVILNRGNPVAYAHALAQLEEVRLSKQTQFMLSLAGDKNQLLHRIKRLMEKSVKNYYGKDRLIPAILLIVGLVCASWLTVRGDRTAAHIATTGKKPLGMLTPMDTVIRKSQKAGKYSRKIITTWDEKGKPHEEVVEVFEGDEALKPLLAIPAVPGQMTIPDWKHTTEAEVIDALTESEAYAFAPFDALAPMQYFYGDTIPNKLYRSRSKGDWHDFAKEFEQRFKDQFADFYKKNAKDFEKMMKEMEEKFQNRFYEDHFQELRAFELTREDQEKMMTELDVLAKISEGEMREIELDAMKQRELALEKLHEWNNGQEEQLEQIVDKLHEHELDLRRVEERSHMLEKRARAFENEVKDELVKDGYLKESDAIQMLNWEEGEVFKVNGIKIKKSDYPKYRAIHRKYFKDQGHFEIVE